MPQGLDTVVPQEFVRVDGTAHRPRRRHRAPAATTGAWPARTWRAARSRSPPAGCCARPTSACSPPSAGPRCRCSGACASPSSPPATSCARSARRSTPGSVYDSNRYTLWAMLQRLGVEVLDLGVVRDDPEALERAFRTAARRRRRRHHHRRRQRRRGRPHPAGARPPRRRGLLADRDAPRPADGRRPDRERRPQRRRLRPAGQSGGGDGHLLRPGARCPAGDERRDAARRLLALRAASVGAVRKKPGRTEYQRGFVERAADGGLQVRVSGAQGSGILRSMSEANGLVVLGHEQGNVAAGELVDVLDVRRPGLTAGGSAQASAAAARARRRSGRSRSSRRSGDSSPGRTASGRGAAPARSPSASRRCARRSPARPSAPT